MSVLPGQKLTIGELFVSMAMGLILYLLPGDLRNQSNSIFLAETHVFLAAFVISAVFFLVIKRYEAMGAMLLTDSLITAGAFVFGIAHGALSSGGDFWPTLNDYQLITTAMLWAIPFFITILFRLFAHDARDTNEMRMGFVRFLSLSLAALLVIYVIIVVFRQIIPQSPDLSPEHSIYYVPFERIGECFQEYDNGGITYLLWNTLIVAPLTFSLMILSERIKLLHVLFISFAFGMAIEIFQFAFNTGTVYVDDIILYLIGGLFGFLFKKMLDYLRSLFTIGQDKHMLSFNYTPLDNRAQRAAAAYSPAEEKEDKEDFDENFSDTSEFQLITDELIEEHIQKQK